jgi:hypothetical protein
VGPLGKRRWDKHTFAVFKRFEPDFVPKGIDIHGDGFAEWRQAGRIGYAGLQLFDLLVSTVAESGNSQKGDLKRLVQVLEPDAGTQASVVAQLAVTIAWNHGKATYMSVVDPDALASWAQSR